MAKKNRKCYRREPIMPWMKLDDKFILFMLKNRIIIVDETTMEYYERYYITNKKTASHNILIKKDSVVGATEKFDIKAIVDLNVMDGSASMPMGREVLMILSRNLYAKAAGISINAGEVPPADVMYKIFEFCDYISDYFLYTKSHQHDTK